MGHARRGGALFTSKLQQQGFPMKLGLVFSLAVVVLSGCSKPTPEEQKKSEEKLAAALASAMAAPASSSATLNGATTPAPAAGGIAATCNNPTDAKCKEFKGAMGLAAEDSCKSLGGIFKKEPTPCSQENLLGTCALVDSSLGLNDVDYFYKQPDVTADSMKTLCEGVMSGTWTPAAKAGPAAKPAAPAKAGAQKGKK
jgi:hypothetical protein